MKIHINMDVSRAHTPAMDRKPETSKLIEKSARSFAKSNEWKLFHLPSLSTRRSDDRKIYVELRNDQIVGQIKVVDSQLPNWRAARSPFTPSPYLRTGGK